MEQNSIILSDEKGTTSFGGETVLSLIGILKNGIDFTEKYIGRIDIN